MARAKKDGVKRSFFLNEKIDDKLNQYSKKTGIPKTTIIEKAIEEFFQKNHE